VRCQVSALPPRPFGSGRGIGLGAERIIAEDEWRKRRMNQCLSTNTNVPNVEQALKSSVGHRTRAIRCKPVQHAAAKRRAVSYPVWVLSEGVGRAIPRYAGQRVLDSLEQTEFTAAVCCLGLVRKREEISDNEGVQASLMKKVLETSGFRLGAERTDANMMIGPG